ncbi:nucleotide disphospho-sugar-binding domain-containing protein, partial [Streptomyces sp. NPDC059742]
ANARLLPFVPLHVLAPTCDAVIHHAGPGTLAAVARHGVPQLSLPYSFDEPLFAGALSAYGAGLHIDPERTAGDTVRAQVLRLLGEPGFRAAAGRLGEEFAALPSPNALVPRLEELTSRFTTGS